MKEFYQKYKTSALLPFKKMKILSKGKVFFAEQPIGSMDRKLIDLTQGYIQEPEFDEAPVWWF
jgi:hypothetical protein